MSKLRRKNWRLSQVKTSSLTRDTLSKIRLHVLALCVYPIEAESFSAASLQLSLDPLGNGRGRLYAVSPLIDPRAMQCWWAPIRVKQLSMAVIARVIWLCACVRYWPYRGAGTCASVHNLILESLRFTFTPNGKREFAPHDQVFPLFFVYRLLLLHKNK